MSDITQPISTLRVYPAAWKGHLLLACRKCQKKLHSDHPLAKLKKALKRQARKHPDMPRLHILHVPCLKLCPKGAVTVCTQTQLAQGTCSVVRTRDDLNALYCGEAS